MKLLQKTSVQKAFEIIFKFIEKTDLPEQEKKRLKNLLLNVKTYSGVV